MMDNDPLRPVLREWEAPEAPRGMDARMRAAYRERYRPSPWRAFWSARVSLPVPVLAAAALVAVALFLQFRSAPAPAPMPLAPAGDYVTRLDVKGFQPLPNGAARVVKVREVLQ